MQTNNGDRLLSDDEIYDLLRNGTDTGDSNQIDKRIRECVVVAHNALMDATSLLLRTAPKEFNITPSEALAYVYSLLMHELLGGLAERIADSMIYSLSEAETVTTDIYDEGHEQLTDEQAKQILDVANVVAAQPVNGTHIADSQIAMTLIRMCDEVFATSTGPVSDVAHKIVELADKWGIKR